MTELNKYDCIFDEGEEIDEGSWEEFNPLYARHERHAAVLFVGREIKSGALNFDPNNNGYICIVRESGETDQSKWKVARVRAEVVVSATLETPYMETL